MELRALPCNAELPPRRSRSNAVLAADNGDEGVSDLAHDELSSFLGKLASQVEVLDSAGRKHADFPMLDYLLVGLLS
jgi:hypothetical protein